MAIGVLALVGLSPERVAALTAAGYAVREGKNYENRIDAVRESGESVRAVLTNGRGGLSGDEMEMLPKLEIVCAVGAGYEAVDLDKARSRGITVANCPDTNASAVADSAMMLLMAATRHLRQADRHVHAGGWQDQWRVEKPAPFRQRPGGVGDSLGTEATRGGGPGGARGGARRAADTAGAPAVRERRGHAALRGARAGGPHRGYGVVTCQSERVFHGEAAAVACVFGEEVTSTLKAPRCPPLMSIASSVGHLRSRHACRGI